MTDSSDPDSDLFAYAFDGFDLPDEFREKWIDRSHEWVRQAANLSKRAAGPEDLSTESLSLFWIRLSETIFERVYETVQSARVDFQRNAYDDLYSSLYDERLVPAAEAQDEIRKALGTERLLYVCFRRHAEAHARTDTIAKKLRREKTTRKLTEKIITPGGLPPTPAREVQKILMSLDKHYGTDRAAARDIATVALPHIEVIRDAYIAVEQLTEALGL